MFKSRQEEWLSEFKDAGVERVRNGLIVGGWEAEKRRAARMWLERKDISAWQAGRPASAVDRPSLKVRLQKSKWWPYVIAVIFALMGIGRLLRRW